MPRKDGLPVGTCVHCDRTIKIKAQGRCQTCWFYWWCEQKPGRLEHSRQVKSEYAKKRYSPENPEMLEHRRQIQREYYARRKEAGLLPGRKPQSDRVRKKRVAEVKKKAVELMYAPGTLCSVCARELKGDDVSLDCDLELAHGVCAVAKGDRSGWRLR